MMITIQPRIYRRLTDSGFTLLELMIVFLVIGIVSIVALPQLVTMRRLQRSAAVPIQVKTQLRLARQQAMSGRFAVTFQYDDQLKQISLIRHQTSGQAVLADPNYPNTVGSVRSGILPLTGNGISLPDLVYGFPAPAAGNLGDGTTLSPLPGNRQLNITFQPDGSVINAAGQPVNFALFFYNAQASAETATAISVLGSAGRVKIWRYSSNANIYAE